MDAFFGVGFFSQEFCIYSPTFTFHDNITILGSYMTLYLCYDSFFVDAVVFMVDSESMLRREALSE